MVRQAFHGVGQKAQGFVILEPIELVYDNESGMLHALQVEADVVRPKAFVFVRRLDF